MSIGNIYEVEDEVTLITTAAILLGFTLQSDHVVQIISASAVLVSGGADTEQLVCTLDRGTSALTGGTSVTPSPVNGHNTASVTALSNPAGGTAANEFEGASSGPSITGWHYNPNQDEGRIFSPSEVVVLKTLATITQATLRVRIRFAEIGG